MGAVAVRPNGTLGRLDGPVVEEPWRRRLVGTRLAIPALTLGSLLVKSPAMTFADFEIFKHWKMTAEPAMLIGMDVLGLLDTLVIDYRRKELQVKLPRS